MMRILVVNPISTEAVAQDVDRARAAVGMAIATTQFGYRTR
jgi:hypothetical protein